MPWKQVCAIESDENGKYCMNLYGITGIPSGFLIDPDGKVIHMTARGGWLNAKLLDLFTQQNLLDK